MWTCLNAHPSSFSRRCSLGNRQQEPPSKPHSAAAAHAVPLKPPGPSSRCTWTVSSAQFAPGAEHGALGLLLSPASAGALQREGSQALTLGLHWQLAGLQALQPSSPGPVLPSQPGQLTGAVSPLLLALLGSLRCQPGCAGRSSPSTRAGCSSQRKGSLAVTVPKVGTKCSWCHHSPVSAQQRGSAQLLAH